eukprot:TRINITY_DN29794_c0_g1_i1.p1 TRINITY_DN29794_c0_g1~~TRINITY_DN29794_c0_g1_i1.p1  ORF type:complete len:345 (+),score=97.29 TRINITY_DN29794_c0_g1_i1:257-1291(+)
MAKDAQGGSSSTAMQAATVAVQAIQLELLSQPQTGPNAALWLLLLLTGVVDPQQWCGGTTTPPSPLQILKARRYLYAELEPLLGGHGNSTRLENCGRLLQVAACLGWLEALCSKMEEVEGLFSNLIGSVFDPKHKQLACQTQLQIVAWHCKARGGSLNMLQATVSAALKTCPQASDCFIQTFLSHSLSPFQTQGSTRRFVHMLCHKQKNNPKLWLVYLNSEVEAAVQAFRSSSAELASASVHRARAVFESVLAKPLWRSELGAAVWCLFIEFELALGSPQAAKRHFFRAIQTSPWSKAIWSHLAGGLSSALKVEDMSQLVELMLQKRIGVFESPKPVLDTLVVV